jgi:hypothetical protein
MRHLSKLFLLAIAALAAMAFAAPLANAQSVEIIEEDSTNHCGAVTNVNHVVGGGCALTAASAGLVTLYNHGNHTGNEAIQSVCTNSFSAAIDEDGHGYIYNQVFGNPVGACFVEPCTESGGAKKPWEFEVGEDPTTHAEGMEVEFCVSPNGAMGLENYCVIHLAIADTGDHQYQVSGTEAGGEDDDPVHPPSECEVTGTWNVTADWEIVH